ncbi:lytic transglycosylase domain-containing protein [Atopobium fossor]|uniref:lytic transglycosylase domain-containing protein n=1 Tax=Atopobium fossor TaxID=39487 RepID=UPI000416BBF7|nr:lytic transglycosylase domain-containing protein [Atopobium fossor]
MLFHSRLRFLRWFRVVPLVIMAVLGLFSAGYKALPAKLTRQVIAPVPYPAQVADCAARHGVDPYLVCAVIKCESGWNETATSPVGAQGLMQLMPATARELAEFGLVNASKYDANNLHDPTTNIEYGCAYLAYLQKQLGSTDKVIAAYNAGIGTVHQWSSQANAESDFSQTISYPETALYLERVHLAYADYQRLWPEGIGA